MPHKHWTLLNNEIVADHRVFRIRHDNYRFEPTGAVRDFVVLECPDWVNVVPVTDDGQIVFIRQYRHGIRSTTWEIPGGVIDGGETPEQAAVRELREETGYVPQSVRYLGKVSPNPAIQGNWSHTFLAEGCRLEADTHFDPFESIEIAPRPKADVDYMIRSGEICHALMIDALTLYRLDGLTGAGQ